MKASLIVILWLGLLLALIAVAMQAQSRSQPAIAPEPASFDSLPRSSSGSILPKLASATRSHQNIDLWSNGAPLARGNGPGDRPMLIAMPASKNPRGLAVIICPGGGYMGVSIDGEGTNVGQWLNDNGVSAFVLQYRVAPYGQPCAMLDVQRAIRLVRAWAPQWDLNPDRIGVMGFSAGGHVASTAATHFDGGDLLAPDPIDQVSCRPDFVALLYPVITMKLPYTHGGCRQVLLGDHPSDSLVEQFSNETQVKPDTPPVFIAACRDDDIVSVQNSILFKDALDQKHIPCEMILFDHGGHGWGMGPAGTDIATWQKKFLDWLGKNAG